MNPAYVAAIVRRLLAAQRKAVRTGNCQLGTLAFLRNQGLCDAVEVNADKVPSTQRYRPMWSALGLAVKAYVNSTHET